APVRPHRPPGQRRELRRLHRRARDPSQVALELLNATTVTPPDHVRDNSKDRPQQSFGQDPGQCCTGDKPARLPSITTRNLRVGHESCTVLLMAVLLPAVVPAGATALACR